MVETTTFTIEDETGDRDEIELPVGFTDVFAEGDETPSEVVGDIAMLSAAQQIHAIVHHGHGEVTEEVAAIEEAVLDRFEDRFGRSFAEMTGHGH